MKKLKCVVAVPGDSLYLREQTGAAKAAADRLGIEVDVVNAGMDSVGQSQQLLNFIQGPVDSRPDAILIEPVSAAGLPRVAEAAVAAGIAWVVSNAQVEYIPELRATAKAPVFLVSQDHVEIGRIEGRQMGALLPDGGTVLYLRGPSMSNVATARHQGVLDGVPKKVEVKNLKVQGSSSENAFTTVASWLALSTVRPEGTQIVASQNADFIFGAKKSFESNTQEPDRSKWLAIPCLGVGVPSQTKPLVDQGVLRAAVLTSVTMDTAIEILARALKDVKQPPEHTIVPAYSYPTLEELTAKPIKRAPASPAKT